MKQLSKRQLIILGGVLTIVVLFFSLFGGGGQVTSGSTYVRTPDGYGAWFQYMEQRGHRIDRWRKVSEKLFEQEGTNGTLLRVESRLVRSYLLDGGRRDGALKQWVERGNTFVVLGVQEDVSGAPFKSEVSHAAGAVTVATRRRSAVKSPLLEDRFGAVVWSQRWGKGSVVMATTPYLAANAYQGEAGNFKFLEQVIKQIQPEGKIWVDEYLHGYRDASERGKTRKQDSVLGYLGQTPWAPIAVQGLVFLVLMIWVGNRRFGRAETVALPEVSNSEAYIQALSGALQKSENSAYILDVVGKAELLSLQQRLGLNNRVLDPPALVEAWVARTGQSGEAIERVLRVRDRGQVLSRSALSQWLGEVRSLGERVD
jgi:Domain of unknown function (DUF4350)